MVVLQTLAVIFMTIFIIGFAIAIIEIIAAWKLFEKAGVEGWKSIIPIYNVYVATVDVAKMDIMWFIFLFLGWIPIIGWVLATVSVFNIAYSISRRFTKETELQILATIFFGIFTLVFAFGKFEYDDSTYSKNGFISDSVVNNAKDGFKGATSQASSGGTDTNSFCKNCGNKINKGDKFCENCGTKL